MSHAEVLKVFGENNATLRDLLFAAIPAFPATRDCPCATALSGTQLSVARPARPRRSSPFVTEERPRRRLGDRIRESVAMIVGRDALEEFRVRTIPLDPRRRTTCGPSTDRAA